MTGPKSLVTREAVADVCPSGRVTGDVGKGMQIKSRVRQNLGRMISSQG